MEQLVKIAVIDNEFEAGLLEVELTAREIPHLLQSYYDVVYDGIFQVQKGWGCVRAPETAREAILELLQSLRQGGDVELLPEEAADTPPESL